MSIKKDKKSIVKNFEVPMKTEKDQVSKENIGFLVLRSLQRYQEYQRLKALLGVQKEIVQKQMHKAMSPISAISGYLSLMRVLLEKGVEKEKVKQYITKSEKVLKEISDIVEDLHEVFDEDDNELRKQSIIGKIKTGNE